MTKFSPEYFPQYQKLSFLERLFLRTCCYFPPRPRRERKMEDLECTQRFKEIYSRAFGENFWSFVQDKQVLDLGCGEGGFVLALAEGGCHSVVGLDIQANFVYASKRVKRLGLKNIDFIQGDTQVLPDNQFDIVVSHDSFEHFANPAYVLAEMIRLTRPSGWLFIKFGPTWRSPWGRHMSGTVRRDRPWIHLVVPEKMVMRCHSVYHDFPVLYEKYDQLSGGLNKMTVARFMNILNQQSGIIVEDFNIFPIASLQWAVKLPVIREFFASGVMICCKRT